MNVIYKKQVCDIEEFKVKHRNSEEMKDFILKNFDPFFAAFYNEAMDFSVFDLTLKEIFKKRKHMKQFTYDIILQEIFLRDERLHAIMAHDEYLYMNHAVMITSFVYCVRSITGMSNNKIRDIIENSETVIIREDLKKRNSKFVSLKDPDELQIRQLSEALNVAFKKLTVVKKLSGQHEEPPVVQVPPDEIKYRVEKLFNGDKVELDDCKYIDKEEEPDFTDYTMEDVDTPVDMYDIDDL